MSSYLFLDLPKDLFPVDLPVNILKAPRLSSIIHSTNVPVLDHKQIQQISLVDHKNPKNVSFLVHKQTRQMCLFFITNKPDKCGIFNHKQIRQICHFWINNKNLLFERTSHAANFTIHPKLGATCTALKNSRIPKQLLNSRLKEEGT